MWAIDFQFDETADYRRIKLCNIVDEFAREALAIRVARTWTPTTSSTSSSNSPRARGAA